MNHFSTPQDKQILVNAFNQGQQDGLVNALQKMKPAGQLQIRGNVGYDLAYIDKVPTATGYNIWFITNRWVRFFESYFDTRSQTYNLTAGEINVDDKNPSKSTGLFFPATELVINKDGDFEWQLFADPWQMTGIIDWNAKKKG